MTSRGRLVAALAAIAGLALAAASQAASAPAARCDAHNVVVWLQGRGDAAAGSIYYTLGLTNLSERRCALQGYPGVSAIDLAGRQLGAPAGRTSHTGTRYVEIAPGRTARVVLRLSDTGVFPTGTCRPVTAAGFRVYLPDATASSIVPAPFRACSMSRRAYLHVTPVAP